jgi:hypothetical protein
MHQEDASDHLHKNEATDPGREAQVKINKHETTWTQEKTPEETRAQEECNQTNHDDEDARMEDVTPDINSDVHCASWRTLEQQGREDDEGKGQRLAVDVKSDLY